MERLSLVGSVVSVHSKLASTEVYPTDPPHHPGEYPDVLDINVKNEMGEDKP